MLAIYERMTKEGKIGPFDAQGRPRPYQEYPKAVRDASGAKRVVNSAREELAIAAETGVQPEYATDDPLIAERNAFAEENERLRLQLAAFAGAPVSPPAGLRDVSAEPANAPPPISLKAPQTADATKKETK